MNDWPTELRPLVDKDSGVLILKSRGPHPFAWIAAPFALALLAAGGYGIATVSVSVVNGIVGVLSLAFGIAIAISTAYTARGSLHVDRHDGMWTITRKLGAFTMTTRLAQGDVRSAEITSAAPYVVLWPGAAGRHVRVHVQRRERPVEIGAGLSLDDATLDTLQRLFT